MQVIPGQMEVIMLIVVYISLEVVVHKGSSCLLILLPSLSPSLANSILNFTDQNVGYFIDSHHQLQYYQIHQWTYLVEKDIQIIEMIWEE